MSSISILLVEDDPIISWDLSAKLNRLNCEVAATYEDQDWMDGSIPIPNVQCIFTNLKLSDGWVDESYIEKLHKLNAKIIVLTGLGNPATHLSSLLSSKVKYLYKPYTAFQLKSCLEALKLAG